MQVKAAFDKRCVSKCNKPTPTICGKHDPLGRRDGVSTIFHLPPESTLLKRGGTILPSVGGDQDFCLGCCREETPSDVTDGEVTWTIVGIRSLI